MVRERLEPTSEWRNAEIKGFLNKVLVALCKVAALILFIGMHSLLDYVLNRAFNDDTQRLKSITQAATTAGFSLVYVAQIWDMIMLFLPAFSFGIKSKEIVGGLEETK